MLHFAGRARVWPGSPTPSGPNFDGRGANFAIFSAHAEKIELCLFDVRGQRELERVVLPEYTDRVWHGYLPDVRPGHRLAESGGPVAIRIGLALSRGALPRIPARRRRRRAVLLDRRPPGTRRRLRRADERLPRSGAVQPARRRHKLSLAIAIRHRPPRSRWLASRCGQALPAGAALHRGHDPPGSADGCRRCKGARRCPWYAYSGRGREAPR